MKKEANIHNEHAAEGLNSKKPKKKYVYPIRDWKEYLGESFLIVFSVLLALFLTEHINKLHEKENTKILLRGISAELNHNKKAIQEMQAYDSMVFEKIDSALADEDTEETCING
jgi:hypothetical protein